MKVSLTTLIAFFWSVSSLHAQDIAGQYLQKWQLFYPTDAARAGLRTAIFDYEDRSKRAIDQWVTFNREVLAIVSDTGAMFTKEQTIDARLLRVQAQSEIDRWHLLRTHEKDVSLYLRLLSNAIPSVKAAAHLTAPEKAQLICKRLMSLTQLSQAGQANLSSATKNQIEDSQDKFKALIADLDALPEALKASGILMDCEGFEENLTIAKSSVRHLYDFVVETLSKSIVPTSDILGKDEYARQLALYTDSELTPETLAEMALKEIQMVRGLMEKVSVAYLQKTYPYESLPDTFEARLAKALRDMEKDVPLNSSDYEQFWNELSEKAISFVKEKGLGTLPEHQTLSIQSAPESAGPAARIGWVGSAPPFDPNPWTTLYLPSIPNTLPEKEQRDFWSSFNKPFNRIIVIHELFPGHYMQLKISRETAHPIRLLFPYGTYIEGWATFCERLALDEGWDDGNEMTMLAHLRKRIENANRAYTSVQVHTRGWTQDQVMNFSTETSLVAPQFAKSLWFRLMRSPMQLTSYFLGSTQFSDLYAAEKERLGSQFDLKLFMDTIMKSGPIPIDEFQEIFARTIPR